jgi:hypothetical protein
VPCRIAKSVIADTASWPLVVIRIFNFAGYLQAPETLSGWPSEQYTAGTLRVYSFYREKIAVFRTIFLHEISNISNTSGQLLRRRGAHEQLHTTPQTVRANRN